MSLEDKATIDRLLYEMGTLRALVDQLQYTIYLKEVKIVMLIGEVNSVKRQADATKYVVSRS